MAVPRTRARPQCSRTLASRSNPWAAPSKAVWKAPYLGDAAAGYPIIIDKHASEADHIVVANRIKAHTKFSGPVESGLMKMMSIGMGKQKGAKFYHNAAVRLTFQNIIENVGKEIIRRCPVLFGLGIVENAYHQTAALKAFPPRDIFDGEKGMLQLSKRLMVKLPFKEIDVLVVDRIGKDISGTGMDTNVIGRNIDILNGLISTIDIKRIFVRELSEETEGNALGIGYADFTTTRLVHNIDRPKTYMNCLTATSPEKGAIPMYFDSDEEALQACYGSIGETSPDRIRLVHIKDTLSLSQLAVSKAFAQEIERNDSLERLSGWRALSLDADRNLASPF